MLVLAGDSVTTDHISPVGGIPEASPAGRYLVAQGVEPADFNNYASRRTNADVGVRGTFANVRFRNDMVPGKAGGFTRHMPDGEEMTIYDAAVRYRSEDVPLVVVAGYQYGAGSSRDWAARGPRFLGVKAILASGFERIHRSNLVGMGILPLQFPDGIDRYTPRHRRHGSDRRDRTRRRDRAPDGDRMPDRPRGRSRRDRAVDLPARHVLRGRGAF